MEVYPADLRNWISRRGGLTAKMIYLQGRELAADRAALRNVGERQRPRHPRTARRQVGRDSRHVRRAASAIATPAAAIAAMAK